MCNSADTFNNIFSKVLLGELIEAGKMNNGSQPQDLTTVRRIFPQVGNFDNNTRNPGWYYDGLFC